MGHALCFILNELEAFWFIHVSRDAVFLTGFYQESPKSALLGFFWVKIDGICI